MLSRRSFLAGFAAAASGLLVPERVRAYSFLSSSSISVNSQKITNLLTPTVSTDAATKGYVDSVSSLTSRLPSAAVDGDLRAVHTAASTRAITIETPGGDALVTFPAGKAMSAEFVFREGRWLLLGYGPFDQAMGFR